MNLQLALLVVLHLTCLVAQLAMAGLGLRRRRLYSFFFAAVAFYQAVSLFTLNDLLRDYGAEAMLHAEIIVLAGTAMVSAFVLVGERLMVVRASVAVPGPIESVIARPGIYLAIATIVVMVITVITLRGGLEVVERTWQQARLEAGYLDSLATLLLFMVFPAAWIAARGKRPFLSALLLLMSLTLFVVYGSRAALLTLPMVMVLDAFLRFGTAPIRLRTITTIVIAALGLHVLGRMVRGFGIAGLIALAQGESVSGVEIADVVANVDLSGGEAAIFRYFLFAVASGPFADIEPLTSVIRWFGMYVPGAMFPGAKPVDLTYTIWWHAYGAGLFDSYESFGELLKVVGVGGGGSLHTLIWGEMWLNGAWAAIPVFAAGLAALLLLIEAVYARVPNVIYVLAAPATAIGYVMVARGNSGIGFGYTAYVLPMAVAAYGLLLAARAVLAIGSPPRDSGTVLLRGTVTDARSTGGSG